VGRIEGVRRSGPSGQLAALLADAKAGDLDNLLQMGETGGVGEYEYSFVQVGANGAKDLVRALNDLTSEGWSLVTVTNNDRTVSLNTLTAVIQRPIVRLPDPANRDPDWYPDPAARFDRRYWNGAGWTFQVTRDSDKSIHRDPPTALAPTANLTQ
jgi:hypothetical protein